MVFFLKNIETTSFNNNLYFDNFNFYLVVFLTLVSFIMFIFFQNLSEKNNVFSDDYYFSIFNIVVFINFIYFSNSFYSFIFSLELVSILIFYKFVVSRSWYKDMSVTPNNLSLKEHFNLRPYVNVIFFQY